MYTAVILIGCFLLTCVEGMARFCLP